MLSRYLPKQMSTIHEHDKKKEELIEEQTVQ